MFRSVVSGATPAGAELGASWVEGRLLAPCCWEQTLDVHQSPLAAGLRTEIAQRLDAGETTAAVEDELVSRYGERMRAVPKGKDPRAAMPYMVACGLLLGLLLPYLLWRRWSPVARRPDARGHRGLKMAADAQLDRELEQLADA